MSMYKPWRSPPPAGPDEFDCVFCEAGETETFNVRVEIIPPDSDDGQEYPGHAALCGIWCGDGWLTNFSHLLPAFVERVEIHAYKVFTGQIKMAEAEYRIAKLEECAAC